MTVALATKLLAPALMPAPWRVWSRQDAEALRERDRLQSEEHADALAERATRAETRRVWNAETPGQVKAWLAGTELAGAGGNKIEVCPAGYALGVVPPVDHRDDGILLPKGHKEPKPRHIKVRGGKWIATGEAIRRCPPEDREASGEWKALLADRPCCDPRASVYPERDSAVLLAMGDEHRPGKLRLLVWKLAPWSARADYEQIAYETALRLYPEWDRDRCPEFFSFIKTPVRLELYDQRGRDRCIALGGGFDAPIHAPWGFNEDGDTWSLADQLAYAQPVSGGHFDAQGVGNVAGTAEEAAIAQRLSNARERQLAAECLMALPATDQQAIIWRHHRGMTDAEMAGRWGCKVDTARKRAERAEERLQKLKPDALSENGHLFRTYTAEKDSSAKPDTSGNVMPFPARPNKPADGFNLAA
jgi:DNA-directed RNA polymerase specialized sigma24 family protein